MEKKRKPKDKLLKARFELVVPVLIRQDGSYIFQQKGAKGNLILL